jgi:phage baseplate assembly protein W
MNLLFPIRFEHTGKTAGTTDDSHIRQMMEQVLFTTPGERVNRPDFGSGLMQLVFEPNSNELAVTTQLLVQGSLQQWLGDLIEVNDVQVQNDEGTLTVSIIYTVRLSGETHQATFTK